MMPDALTDARAVLAALEKFCAGKPLPRPLEVLAAQRRLVAALEKAEPVAWRHRGRASVAHDWEGWRVTQHKPQGPANERFQMEPLYAHPPLGVSVPEEPTDAMLDAAYEWREHLEIGEPTTMHSTMREQYRAFYRAMLAARPK